ncbi:MAG: hypothetical protein EXR10_05065 [Alphaproteobacteria bacterium]|nr:hypothetical protein [Alphaproteobacteria bacterium]PHY00783.1 MAG: hypothetical protein CK529_04700 [Rhodospirillaceae bacterium]
MIGGIGLPGASAKATMLGTGAPVTLEIARSRLKIPISVAVGVKPSVIVRDAPATSTKGITTVWRLEPPADTLA